MDFHVTMYVLELKHKEMISNKINTDLKHLSPSFNVKIKLSIGVWILVAR